MTTRIESLKSTRKSIQHLTEAYQASLIDIINDSDLHSDGKLCAKISVNNDDILNDVVHEFDQYIGELEIEAQE